nr:hypothetical protein [Tanacetum cinerariifolium]
AAKQSRDDAPIKRSINEREAANARISNESEQEQIDAQVAKELEEQQEKED